MTNPACRSANEAPRECLERSERWVESAYEGAKLTAKTDVVVMHKAVDSIKLATDVVVLRLVVKVLDGRMFLVTAKDVLSFLVPMLACEPNHST